MKIDMQSSTFQPPLSCAINQKRRILSSSMAKPLDASFGSAIFGSSTLSPPRQRQTNIAPLTWRRHGHGVSTTAPDCFGHTAVAYKGCIYLYGGDVKDNRRISGVHKYSVATESWSKVVSTGCDPETRSGHTAVVYKNAMYTFGGRDGRIHFADIKSFCFDDNRWSKLETRGAVVKRRHRHSACVHENKMYVFGGEFFGGDREIVFADFYEFNIDTKTWTEIHATGDLPPARSGHSAVIHNDSMYIFGGRNKEPQYFRDIYRYHFASNSWSKVEVLGNVFPPRTYNHSAFIYRNSLYVFGGYGMNQGVEDGPGIGHRHSKLFEFSFETNRWSLVQPGGKTPSARLGHTITLVDGQLFLFGGWDRNGYRSDLHSITFDDVGLDMLSLLRNEDVTDVVFQFDGHPSLYAHKAVLWARCPHLVEACQIDRKSNKHEKAVVKMEETNFDVFRLVLEYLYTDSLPFDPNLVVEVYVFATQYELKRCKEIVAFLIKRNLISENVLMILQRANDHDVEEIKQFCLRFIGKHYDEVVMSEHVKELRRELLVELLRVSTKEFQNDCKAGVLSEERDAPKPSLKEDLLALVGQKRYSDILFKVQGTKLPAHYCILRARQSALPRMFDSGMRESITKTVELENVEVDTFRKLLNYLYAGEISIENAADGLELLVLADRYLIDSLKVRCEAYVRKEVNPTNVLQVLDVADACNLKDLREVCLDIISTEFSSIAQRPELEDLRTGLLVSIIRVHAKTCSDLECTRTHNPPRIPSSGDAERSTSPLSSHPSK